jgi:hypothetical protein
VTRMENETASAVSMPQIKESVLKHWQTVFGNKLEPMALSGLSVAK